MPITPNVKPKELPSDLRYAIQYNTDHHQSPVAKLIFEIEGENDERDWHWIVQLQNGRFAYGWGGCDYTGWDCQSNINWKDSKLTIRQAIADVACTDNNNRNPHALFMNMLKEARKPKSKK